MAGCEAVCSDNSCPGAKPKSVTFTSSPTYRLRLRVLAGGMAGRRSASEAMDEDACGIPFTPWNFIHSSSSRAGGLSPLVFGGVEQGNQAQHAHIREK